MLTGREVAPRVSIAGGVIGLILVTLEVVDLLPCDSQAERAKVARDFHVFFRS